MIFETKLEICEQLKEFKKTHELVYVMKSCTSLDGKFHFTALSTGEIRVFDESFKNVSSLGFISRFLQWILV